MAHRISGQVESDLDEIWLYVASESGSIDLATQVIDSITSRFVLLSGFPYAGRARDNDFGIGSRSFPVGEYVIVYCIEAGDVLILRVVHGKRQLADLFGA